MEQFSIADTVTINRNIRAGRSEDGPFICNKGTKGIVVKIESSEWDGVHVKLDSGALWWFKPNQLSLLQIHT